MKKISIKWLVLVAVCLVFSASTVYAGGKTPTTFTWVMVPPARNWNWVRANM